MYFLINLPAENGYKQQQIKVKTTLKTDSLYFVFLKSTLFYESVCLRRFIGVNYFHRGKH